MSGVEVIAEVGSIEACGFCNNALRQLGDVRGDAPSLVAGEEVRCRSTAQPSSK